MDETFYYMNGRRCSDYHQTHLESFQISAAGCRRLSVLNLNFGEPVLYRLQVRARIS